MDLIRFCLLLGLALVVHGHERRINLAALANGAQCTSDSEIDASTSCSKALDSRMDPADSEWITERDAVGAHINITLAMVSQVDEIRILQRCNTFDRTSGVTVQYSDGSSQQLSLTCQGTGETGLDCDGITWQSFPVSSVTTSYITMTLSEVCDPGSFYGFREVVVMGRQITESDTPNLAPKYLGGTCESSSDDSDPFTCQNAIDQVIGPLSDEAWMTAEGDAVGSWLKISLPSRSEISKVRIKNRCVIVSQMKTVTLDFGQGVSQSFSLNCLDGSNNDCDEQIWNELEVPNIVTTSVNITGTESCDPNPLHGGFQEVELHGQTEGDRTCPFSFTELGCLSSCYRFVYDDNMKTNATNAKAVCSSFHPDAHPVEINTAEEQQQIAQMADQINADGASCLIYFTGGIQVAGEWIWEYSGNPVGFTDWAPGNPASNTGYDYLRLSDEDNWQWVNNVGTASHCYLCEKEI